MAGGRQQATPHQSFLGGAALRKGEFLCALSRLGGWRFAAQEVPGKIRRSKIECLATPGPFRKAAQAATITV